MPYAVVIDPALEDAWKDLLDVYQGIPDFETAFEELLGDTDSAREFYDEQYADAIKESTKDEGEISSQEHARKVTGPFDGKIITEDNPGTYYHARFTSFKSIGLITGVNIRYDAAFQLAKKDYSTDKSQAQQISETGPMWMQEEHSQTPVHPRPSTFDSPQSLSVLTSTVTSGTERGAGGRVGAKKALYFISPPILEFLVKKGALEKARGTSSSSNPYLKLAAELYNLLAADYVAARKRSLRNNEGPSDHHRALRTKIRERFTKTAEILLSAGFSQDLLQPGLTVAQASAIHPDAGIWSTEHDDHKLTIETGFNISSQNGLASGGYARIEGIPGINSGITFFIAFELFGWAVEDDPHAYKHWGDSSSAINKIDKLIRELIVKDIGDRLSDAELKDRKNERLTDIVGFFGQLNKDSARATGQVTDITSDDAAGLRAKIVPPKRNLTPIDLQCYLLEQVRKISSQHNSDYKNIVKLTTGGQPGLVKNQLSQRYTSAEAEALLTLCPNVQALLVPYLKLWRVDYDDNGKAVSEVLLDIPNFINTNDINNILKRGRLPGAGIKSFTWSLDGVQPAEVDNNISATLEMYFQSVSDFFNGAKHAGTKGRASYLDLVIASPTVNAATKAAAKEKAQAEADKAAADPKAAPTAECSSKVINNRAQEYKGQSYRIKIAAGWADPSPEALKAVGNKRGILRRAIAKSKITLFLQQTRHQFKFNENGSLNLTVEYQAALSGMTTSPSADILTPSGNGYIDSIKAQEKVIKEHKETHKDNETDETKAAYKEMLEKLKKARAQDRLLKYKKFLKKLFESDKIYNLAVDPAEMLLPSYADLTPEDRARRAKRRKNHNPEIFSTGGAQNQVLLDAVSNEAQNGGSGEAAAESATEAMMKTYEEVEAAKEVIWVSYFYLGDLLDLVLEQIKENTERDSLPFSFFLSEVEMIDPLTALQIKDLAEIIKCGQDLKEAAFLATLVEADTNTFTKEAGIYELMNIGDVPISVDAFQVWFKNYVVKKDREKYYFLHFVKDICGELITKALSSKCFGPDVKFVQRFDAQPISYNNQASAEFSPNTTIPALRGNGSSTAALSLCREIRKLDHMTAPKNAQLGLVLLGTDSKPKGLRGASSYRTDRNQGVYHNYLGAACGLLKTVNFNREDQPYLREAKIQREGSFSSAQLRELYSAEMEMYGNILYKNGSYVYINPSFIGAPIDKLNILGLHGYYLITGVNSTVTENSFNVSVKALHEGISFDQPLLVNPATLAAGQEEWKGLAPERAPGAWKPPAGAPSPTGDQSVKREAATGDSEEHQARAKKRMWINRLKTQREEEGWTDEQYLEKMDAESGTYDAAIAAALKADAEAAAAETPTTPAGESE